jgi:hypothetical protein
MDASRDAASTASVLALAGGPSSGKTALAAALVAALRDSHAASQGLTARWHDPRGRDHHRRTVEFVRQMGGTRRTTGHLVPAVGLHFPPPSDDDAVAPDIDDFTIASTAAAPTALADPRPWWRGRGRQWFVSDAPGAAFLDTDFLRIQHQFRRPAGILLAVDPFAFPTVRLNHAMQIHRLGIADRLAPDNPVDVLTVLARGLRTLQRLGPDDVIRTPLAVVLTKVRLLESVAATPGLDPDHAAIVRTLRSDAWGGDLFARTADANFAHVRYFTTTALTAPPTNGHAAKPELNPQGVLDPLLWIFEHSRDSPAYGT